MSTFDIENLLKGNINQGMMLIGSAPGIGSSTLAKQISYNVCQINPDIKVLYAIADNCIEHAKKSFERLKCLHQNLHIIEERDIDNVIEVADAAMVSVIVIDPIMLFSMEPIIPSVVIEKVDERHGLLIQMQEIGRRLKNWSRNQRSVLATFDTLSIDKKGEILAHEYINPDTTLILTASKNKMSVRRLQVNGYRTAIDLQLTDCGFVYYKSY